MIQTRRFQPQDIDCIISSSEKLSFDNSVMADKLEHMMLVSENAEICGIGFYMNYEDCCLLNWVFIKEEKRRGRLGTMLVKTMLNTAEKQGAKKAYMVCESQGFAEFLGFNRADAEKLDEICRLYQEVYGCEASADKLYVVSLLDYFKPCCHKE
jgi:N-acetylglutamate synthase-like GNAT family acetyltransferase